MLCLSRRAGESFVLQPTDKPAVIIQIDVLNIEAYEAMVAVHVMGAAAVCRFPLILHGRCIVQVGVHQVVFQYFEHAGARSHGHNRFSFNAPDEVRIDRMEIYQARTNRSQLNLTPAIDA